MKPGDLVKATDKLRLISGFIINVGDVGLVVGMADAHWGSSRHLCLDWRTMRPTPSKHAETCQ